MFKNYQIVIFRDQHGSCRKLRFRGWLFAGILLVLTALAAGDLYLVKYYYNYKQMQHEVANREKQAQSQNSQLLTLASKVRTLESDLTRIRGLDAKLRQMVNLDQAPREVAPSGSGEQEFTQKYLPLYRQEMLTRKLHQFLTDLREKASLTRIHQQELLTVLASKGPRLASMPTIWPVAGWIAAPFGEYVSPFTGKKELRKGMDIAAPSGTPVVTPGGGTVTFSGETDEGDFGVTIDHQNGLTTTYGHLRDAVVTKGQSVHRGELLGHVGGTEQAAGPHLYYEVRLGGIPVNPSRYILE